MKHIILLLLTISFLTSCKNSDDKKIDNGDRSELLPEPDKDLSEEYEKQKELSQLNCNFLDPDTSVAGIKLGNVESTLKILGKKTKLEGDSTHVFYSNDKMQKLGLTVHAGSYHSEVSIFTISPTDNSKLNLRQVNTKEFETEKGIKLGMNKKEIIDKLGTCYYVKDSTSVNIELKYRLELPQDSKTNLLRSNNMPIYYANYRFNNDKLNYIEFGFEYP